jgi:hypothetical protein
MVYFVCVESGGNRTDYNIRPVSGKSMMGDAKGDGLAEIFGKGKRPGG